MHRNGMGKIAAAAVIAALSIRAPPAHTHRRQWSLPHLALRQRARPVRQPVAASTVTTKIR
jgi:hypothetical protein